MKLLVELEKLDKNTIKAADGLILALKDFSVQSSTTHTKEEIAQIKKANPNKEIFVSVNKNIFNDELESLKDTLIYLDTLNLTGIFFYDLAIVQLKKELNLKVDLVWNQTFMVNNYKTCNYYHQKGIKYALLSKEITLEEILEIAAKSTIIPMVEVVSLPSVAFSKRHLLTNYYHHLAKSPKYKITITEKATNQEYEVIEDENGTNFYLKTITNGTSVIKELYDNNIAYIIMRSYEIPSSLFTDLVVDTKKYIASNCCGEEYVSKYSKLGNDTNFFFKKTVYRVKKNG